MRIRPGKHLCQEEGKGHPNALRTLLLAMKGEDHHLPLSLPCLYSPGDPSRAMVPTSSYRTLYITGNNQMATNNGKMLSAVQAKRRGGSSGC